MRSKSSYSATLPSANQSNADLVVAECALICWLWWLSGASICWLCWFALELRLCALRLVERFLMGGFQPQQLSTYALTLFRCAPSNHSAQSIVQRVCEKRAVVPASVAARYHGGRDEHTVRMRAERAEVDK